MPTKTKLAVTVNGRKFTRVSDRDYTHVVIGKPRRTADEEVDKCLSWEKDHRKTWQRHSDIAAGIVTPKTPKNLGYPNSCRVSELVYVVDERKIVRSKAFIVDYPTANSYVDSVNSRHIANIRAAEKRGRYGWQVISWHQSAALATKSLGKSWAVGCRVAPVGTEIRIND